MPRKRRRPPRGGAPGRHLPWDSLHPTLDLHGETGESARRKAERWLREQQLEGARTVRLITGRGLHSIGPPVLRGEMEDLLRLLRGTVVAEVQAESGGGVLRVELRRISTRAAPLRPPRPALSAADPELRRQAEESLVELGVTPTPALLEAEIRRLRGERGRKGK